MIKKSQKNTAAAVMNVERSEEMTVLSEGEPFFITEYFTVKGVASNGSEWPYVNDVASLASAIAIAKTYPGVYQDGFATHVGRHVTVTIGDRTMSAMTHEYGIRENGEVAVLRVLCKTDQEIILSAQLERTRQTRILSAEEITRWTKQIAAAKNSMIGLIDASRNARKRGFRLVYFAGQKDNDRNIRQLVESIVGCENDEAVRRYFDQEIRRLVSQFAVEAQSSIAMLDEKMMASLPPRVCEAITGQPIWCE